MTAASATTFVGFPSRAQATAIPNVFFTDILPQLAGDPCALGIVLYVFRALMAKRGFPRYIETADIAGEQAVANYAANARREDTAAAVRDGLTRGAELGVLLLLTVDAEGGRRELYFLNAPADRRGLEAVRSGTVEIGCAVPPAAPAAPARSSVFTLYESLIGTISPLVADELAEAERLYPAPWLEAAFREAAAQNARSWRYVSRILERWANEGPDYATTERDPAGDAQDGGRYFAGKYGRILKQRSGN